MEGRQYSRRSGFVNDIVMWCLLPTRARATTAPPLSVRGPIAPPDVLADLGIRELQRYLVDEIQGGLPRARQRTGRRVRAGDPLDVDRVMNRGGERADDTPLSPRESQTYTALSELCGDAKGEKEAAHGLSVHRRGR